MNSENNLYIIVILLSLKAGQCQIVFKKKLVVIGKWEDNISMLIRYKNMLATDMAMV